MKYYKPALIFDPAVVGRDLALVLTTSGNKATMKGLPLIYLII